MYIEIPYPLNAQHPLIPHPSQIPVIRRSSAPIPVPIIDWLAIISLIWRQIRLLSRILLETLILHGIRAHSHAETHVGWVIETKLLLLLLVVEGHVEAYVWLWEAELGREAHLRIEAHGHGHAH